MDTGPGQIGKILILTGLVLVAAGAVFVILGKLGVFRLPGDVEFGGRGWKVYLPITSCILLSVVLTLILWLISYFRR